MARPLRVQFEGAVYHLTIRPNGRQVLFRSGRDKDCYLGLLERYQMRLGFRIYAFVLMSRRIELLVETPRGNISKVMQCLGTSYTSDFNRRYRRRGALFAGRYGSRLIAWRNELVEVSRQIHRKHFRYEMSTYQRRYYRWSSYRCYLNKSGLKLVDTEPVLSCFGLGEKEQRSNYRLFVESGKRRGQFSPLNLDSGGSLNLTPSAGYSASQSRDRIKDSEEDSFKRAGRILQEVTLSLDGGDRNRVARRRKGAIIRHVAMYFIRRQTSLPLRLIGKLLGVKAPAVALAIGKVERLLKDEAFYNRMRGLFESDLTGPRDPAYLPSGRA